MEKVSLKIHIGQDSKLREKEKSALSIRLTAVRLDWISEEFSFRQNPTAMRMERFWEEKCLFIILGIFGYDQTPSRLERLPDRPFHNFAASKSVERRS